MLSVTDGMTNTGDCHEMEIIYKNRKQVYNIPRRNYAHDLEARSNYKMCSDIWIIYKYEVTL